MSWRGHIVALAVLAGAGLLGLNLWSEWGAQVWLADFAAFCG